MTPELVLEAGTALVLETGPEDEAALELVATLELLTGEELALGS